MKNIKFISYKHDSISLCRGTITMNVDGVSVEYTDIISTEGYSHFPHGYNNPPEIIKGPWKFKYNVIKECWNLYQISDVDVLYTKDELDYILYLINAEIEWGCCGACI